MSIISSEIILYHSGGSGNSNPNADLGGAISTTAVTDATANNIFDDVTPSEATAGSTEYRGLYFKNTNASLTLQDARIYIASATSSADDEVDIGVAVEGVSTTMATIANETTAPTSVTFSRPTTYSAGLQLNGSTGLAAAAYRGFWIRRTVNAGAASTSDSFQVRCEGSTA